jgi:hypothetical protein
MGAPIETVNAPEPRDNHPRVTYICGLPTPVPASGLSNFSSRPTPHGLSARGVRQERRIAPDASSSSTKRRARCVDRHGWSRLNTSAESPNRGSSPAQSASGAKICVPGICKSNS